MYASYSVVSTCATGSHGGDAAVGHEFWNSDGAGACKQFRGNNDGGFAAAVKIDTFAYLPVQDFGNAYSTFVAQNYGVKDYGRIQKGTKEAFAISIVFSIIISIRCARLQHL